MELPLQPRAGTPSNTGLQHLPGSVPVSPGSIPAGAGSVLMGQGTASSALGKDFNQLCLKPCSSAGALRSSHTPLSPQNPPNFLRASALSEHISPVVVIPAEASSPDSEPITDLVEMDTASQVSCHSTACAPQAAEGIAGALWLPDQGCFSKTMPWSRLGQCRWPWALRSITAVGPVGTECQMWVLHSLSQALVISQCSSWWFGALQ